MRASRPSADLYCSSGISNASRLKWNAWEVDNTNPPPASRHDPIDGVQLRAVPASLHNEWPQVNIRAVDVARPREDELRFRELLWFGSVTHADGGVQSSHAGRRTDGPVEPGCTQAMKESA